MVPGAVCNRLIGAALAALVITRVLILMSFEFRITPPPADDELAMVLAGQLRDEVIAEAISLVPGVVLFVLTWPSGNRSSAGSPG